MKIHEKYLSFVALSMILSIGITNASSFEDKGVVSSTAPLNTSTSFTKQAIEKYQEPIDKAIRANNIVELERLSTDFKEWWTRENKDQSIITTGSTLFFPDALITNNPYTIGWELLNGNLGFIKALLISAQSYGDEKSFLYLSNAYKHLVVEGDATFRQDSIIRGLQRKSNGKKLEKEHNVLLADYMAVRSLEREGKEIEAQTAYEEAAIQKGCIYSAINAAKQYIQDCADETAVIPSKLEPFLNIADRRGLAIGSREFAKYAWKHNKDTLSKEFYKRAHELGDPEAWDEVAVHTTTGLTQTTLFKRDKAIIINELEKLAA